MTRGFRRIGVFDSGIGGLTVLRHLVKAFPDVSFVYLGDVARVPYGTRAPEVIALYTAQCLDFLAHQRVDSIVIACNTASSWLRSGPAIDVGVPLYEVVGPSATQAAGTTKSGRIGVIGTRATVSSGSYKKVLLEANPSLEVFSAPCPLFVPCVEEGLIRGEVVNRLTRGYLREIRRERVDTLILGCTHYPLLRPVIEAFLGPEVALIEAGPAVVASMAALAGSSKSKVEAAGSHRVLLTSPLRRETYSTLRRLDLLPDWPIEIVDLERLAQRGSCE